MSHMNSRDDNVAMVVHSVMNVLNNVRHLLKIVKRSDL